MNIRTTPAHPLEAENPPAGLSIPLTALWWDAKGDWTRAHTLVDSSDSQEAMAVHAYLHRKQGVGLERRLLVPSRRPRLPPACAG